MLALGLRWVAAQGDAEFRHAATGALAKVAAILPEAVALALEDSPLLAPPCAVQLPSLVDLSVLRRALREERMVVLSYRDAAGARSDRRIWPIALGFFDQRRILAAYCELRGGFRHFRVDRIVDWRPLDEKPPRRRRALAREWRAAEGIGLRGAADRN